MKKVTFKLLSAVISILMIVSALPILNASADEASLPENEESYTVPEETPSPENNYSETIEEETSASREDEENNTPAQETSPDNEEGNRAPREEESIPSENNDGGNGDNGDDSGSSSEDEGYTVLNVDITEDESPGDIYAKIQAALDEARDSADVDNPYKIVIPRGIFRINSTLLIYGNVYLEMTGAVILKDASQTSGAMMRFGEKESVSSEYEGVGNVTVHGGTFDAWDNVSQPVRNTMIRFGHGRNITFDSVTFIDNINSHFVELAACKDVTIKDCQFLDQHIADDDTSNHEALQIDALQEVSFPLYEAYDGTSCNNITVTGCTFRNVDRGVGTHAAILDDNGYYGGITVTGNTFENITNYAVNTLCWINSEISNNVIKNTGYGILFRTMRSDFSRMYDGNLTAPVTDFNSVISNNTIEAASVGIKLYGVKIASNIAWSLSDGTSGTIPAGDYMLSNVTVRDNTIASKGYGVFVSHTCNSQIGNNKITLASVNSSSSGVYFSNESGSNSIGDNIITNSSSNALKAGILLSGKCKQNAIMSNTVKGNFTNGIFIYSQSNKSNIAGNKVSGAGYYGIHIYGSINTVIESNTVSSSAGSGIGVRASSAASSVASNKVSVSGGTSLVVDSSTVTNINKNTLSGGNNGVYTNDSKVTNIKNNTAGKSSVGIYVKGSTIGSIASNTLSSNKTYGVETKNSIVSSVQSNSISGAKSYGVISFNSSGTVTKNTVKSSGIYGMYFDGNATNKIFSNTFSGNKGGNIYLKGSTPLKATNLSAPVLSSVKNTAYNKNVLTWGKVANASHYGIYRSTDNKKFSYIGYAKATKSSYTDDTAVVGTTYYYKVLAMTKASKATVFASYSPIKSKLTKGVGSVSAKKVVQGNSQSISVKWSSGVTPQYYEIYRKTSSSGYKKIKTVRGTVCRYSDADFIPGRTYRYKVRSVTFDKNKKAVRGEFSKAVKLKAKVVSTDVVSATRGKDKKNIRISLKNIKGNSGYAIYYSANRDKGYKLLKRISSSRLKKGIIVERPLSGTVFIKVRSYRNVKGRSYYSNYSNIKYVK